MKIFFIILGVCFLSLSGLYAGSLQSLTRNQIMVTDNGFLINLDGQVHQVESLSYAGNGIYSSSQPYYGSCGKCGWALKEDGRCPNRNCNGYGPDRD